MSSPTAHPHSSTEARRIAEKGTILRVQVGSGVHGTAISGQDDRDAMGVCLEPAEYVTGIARVPRGDGAHRATVAFEQWEHHTAWEREGGLRNRSGAGDLDVTIYSARKYARLAAAGNPTVLLPLFVPEHEVVLITAAGRELREGADAFASVRAADRFLGYLDSQRRAMTGEGPSRTNRPELVALHGYDTKFAMHALRLGLQGIEYVTTGRLTLPVPEPHLSELLAVRRGECSLGYVLTWCRELEEGLRAARSRELLPPEPDWRWINGWLHRSYLQAWEV